MFGFVSSKTARTWNRSAGRDEFVADEPGGFVLRFEPYPETRAPQSPGEWPHVELQWADDDLAGDDIDDSDPQPGYDDHDFDEADLNWEFDSFTHGRSA